MVNKNFNARIGKGHYYMNGNPFNAAKNNADFKAVKQDPVQVIAKIVKQQRSLFNKEIRDWKVARAEAENPYRHNRVLLMELYHDIYLDAFIKGIIVNKRILKISNKPFRLLDSEGNEALETMKLMQKKWMNQLIKLAMESRFFGYSLVYFWEMMGNEFSQVKLVDRRHVMPEFSRWVQWQHDLPQNGFDYTQPPFRDYMVGIGDPEDLGLLNSAAPLYILKKHSWANWDEFEEIFGVPMRIAKVASNDKAVRAEVERWLRDMGTAPYGIFPQDSELDIKENTRADAFEVFDKKRKAANEELEVLLTGGRSVTQDQGNYGKEKVNQEEQNEIVEDDKTFITNVMNEQVMPLLRANGYPVDGLTFTYDETEWLDPKERLAIFQGADALGYELDQAQVEKDLGVTITGKRERSQFDGGMFGRVGGREGEDESGRKGEGDKGLENSIKSVIELNNLYFGNKK
jgi:hypothetical protein